MSDTYKYPISEIFNSIQGEGNFCGVMMTFIRLAGCTVGKPFPEEHYKAKMDPIEGAHEIPGLPIYTEQCTLYDGRTFACDTDYRVKERLTFEQLIERIPTGIKHVCITGGEPFIHDLNKLAAWCETNFKMMHIETSGSQPLSRAFPSIDHVTNCSDWHKKCWITVSPKIGVRNDMIIRADEIKLLVDEDFDIAKLALPLQLHKLVYIQPVNYEHSVNAANLKLVVELQKQYPDWRISLQLHKILSHYCGERIL